jgi:hypothetical protein
MGQSPQKIAAREKYRLAAPRAMRRVSAFVVATAAVLAIRAAYTVWQCETAPGVLMLFVKDSTAGWLGWQHEPIHSAEPSQQADFWLAELDRLPTEPPTSEIAIAAAWLLDSPGTGFQARHLRATGISQIPVIPDSDAISRAVQAFETKATPRCTALAELATQTAPNDVQTWRNRALLVFGPPSSPISGQPRSPDWKEIIAKAAEHDPDNALYDYLVANRLWQESIDYDFSEDDVPLIVRDDSKFAESAFYFQRAQGKPFVRGPDYNAQAVQYLLSRAGVPRHEQPALINIRLCEVRESLLLYSLLRREMDLAKRQPLEAQLSHLRSGFRLVEQTKPVDDLTKLQTVKWISETAASGMMVLLRDDCHELETSAAADVERELRAVYTRNMVWDAARDVPPASPPAATYAEMISQPLLDWLLSSAVLLAGIAVITSLGGRVIWRRPAPRQPGLGIIRASTCWLVAFGMSFVVLGLAPAEVLSIAVQHAIFRAFVLNVPWVAAITAIVLLLRRRKWRFSLGEFVLVMPIVGPLLLAWLAFSVAQTIESDGGWHVPTRSFNGLEPELLHALAPMLNPGSAAWCLFEWSAYGGPTAAILLGLALIAVWSCLRTCRDDDGAKPTWQTRTRNMVRAIGRAAAAGAVFALVAFLAAAPSYLRQCQLAYDRQMTSYSNLSDQRAELAARIKSIESDPSQTQRFEASADEFLRSENP